MGYWAAGAGVVVLALSWGALSFAAAPAPAQAGGACRGVGPEAQPVPPGLAEEVITSFHARMTPEQVERTGFVRCEDGVLLACLIGANLDCGMGNAAQVNRGAAWWCSRHPNADFVPLFAAGHDTIFAWRCRGRAAVIERQVKHLDTRGYVAENWQRVQ